MAIPDFDGYTFVAFTDISGFKEMMEDERLAVRALDHFYQAGFDVLQEHGDVHGVLVSGCAILFVSGGQRQDSLLHPLLSTMERLNRNLLRHDIMLTTSISYGRFIYHQRFEFEGIEKNPVFGNAYVAALLDNERGSPRIQPGECRIVNSPETNVRNCGADPRLIRRGKHTYFYWMAHNADSIEAFRRRYQDAYQQKYRGMLEALKEAVRLT